MYHDFESLAGFIQCFYQIVTHTNWFESYEAAVICKDDTWRESFSTTTKTNTSIKTHIRKWEKFHTNMFKHWSLGVNSILCSVVPFHWQNRYLLTYKKQNFLSTWIWALLLLNNIFKKLITMTILIFFFLWKIIFWKL